jgi:hypothetical protein
MQRSGSSEERTGDLPQLEMVYLPNDHTPGTTPKSATPRSYIAGNDLALGKLVDTVSHSRYWSSTGISVFEDDAQDGLDHVDAHRSPSRQPNAASRHPASARYRAASAQRNRPVAPAWLQQHRHDQVHRDSQGELQVEPSAGQPDSTRRIGRSGAMPGRVVSVRVVRSACRPGVG